ncbi:hypothetical protein AVEN_187023-1 [Araneus ventricosus]|uniref:Uncharacterized protein n=1 Tax=Araneus ventricosus TaxID=182803 RepID=A0A4Y2HBG1_ARAVE|nr:hypothetical protein AVEN_187023-1 [Araneus ventricosus]
MKERKKNQEREGEPWAMDELFGHRGVLKKDSDPQKVQEYLELPSGSEEDFSGFSDEDPAFNPDELEAYTSSDDEDY